MRAGLSLVIGSLGAPILYLIVGYLSPGGFHDMHPTSFERIALTFGTAWFFSLILTLPIGGLAWPILHAIRIDGFTSYCGLAVLAFLPLHLLSSADNLN